MNWGPIISVIVLGLLCWEQFAWWNRIIANDMPKDVQP